jgi:rsbT co-antagonist protein RsbR
MTGIRSDLAGRVVREGIDFSSFRTYATVMQAIESLKE